MSTEQFSKQELNIEYVATTRTLNELSLVEGDD
jgi:hypothetical protein